MTVKLKPIDAGHQIGIMIDVDGVAVASRVPYQDVETVIQAARVRRAKFDFDGALGRATRAKNLCELGEQLR